MDRSPLTTDIEDLCFIDTETRSTEDVKNHGAYRHTANGHVIILTYAIGMGEVQDWCVTDLDKPLHTQDMPQDLYEFWLRAKAGKAWFVAHNAAFDRLAMSRGIDTPDDFDGPLIEIEMMIDSMAQGVKSHLPADLAGAAQWTGAATQKDTDGKRLIKLFCDANRKDVSIKSHAEDWAKFVSYARDDIGALRDIYLATLPLSRVEWEEYWASERVNDRGIPFDIAFAEAAAELADLNSFKANADVKRVSNGDIQTVNQVAKMTDWVMDRLGHLPRVRDILTKEIVENEPDENGNDMDEVKLSLERTRIEEVILYLEALDANEGLTDEEFEALEMLEVRVYGASTTPKKFAKVLAQQEDGRLKGSYVLNGAPATGRYSSRGVQTHNLTRSTIGTTDDELDAIELITEKRSKCYETLKDRYGPVGRTLSRLIRPAIVAPQGQMLAWCDWSAIEARVLPWLADRPKADKVLDIFRTNDADPSLPDIYKTTASDIFRVLGQQIDATEITKQQRQSHGKVPVLALGFGGGNGALFAMAAAYGATFSDDEATEVVKAWRDTNPWARSFWDDLWETALTAMDNPNSAYMAGRLTFIYVPDYMRGTLFMVLPCGRELLYPRIKWERREVKDKKTGVVKERNSLTYQRGRGRSAIWYGTLVENATQGSAGSLQRHAITRLQDVLVAHTHDEDIAMAYEDDIEAVAARLKATMLDVPVWAEGLPLAAEVTINDFYTKTLD